MPWNPAHSHKRANAKKPNSRGAWKPSAMNSTHNDNDMSTGQITGVHQDKTTNQWYATVCTAAGCVLMAITAAAVAGIAATLKGGKRTRRAKHLNNTTRKN